MGDIETEMVKNCTVYKWALRFSRIVWKEVLLTVWWWVILGVCLEAVSNIRVGGESPDCPTGGAVGKQQTANNTFTLHSASFDFQSQDGKIPSDLYDFDIFGDVRAC